MEKPLIVYGQHDEGTIQQISTALADPAAVRGVLSADGHVGYSFPIGGTVAYRNAVSPSGVGYDIACGNKAVRLDVKPEHVLKNINEIMDEVWNTISFGVGRKNKEQVDHLLFNDWAWDIDAVKPLKDLAREQLGTVGSGNHFVDIFVDEQDRVWVGVHFGSRGLGHKIATHYIKAAGGKDGMYVEPVVLKGNSDLGYEYWHAMMLAGKYAYAGRDWVCEKVAGIIGGKIVQEVHNHHNFAWLEFHDDDWLVVVRKGATPAFKHQWSFIGGSMGDASYIVVGMDTQQSRDSLFTTVHGAGRVMSRTQAAGKTKYDKVLKQKVQISEGLVSSEMMMDWVVRQEGVCLRGGGVDESPHVYRRLDEVLQAQGETINIVHRLQPIGVAMAGRETYDPYKD